ncbi:MAG: VOC family protein [Streptosporangiales bacterium]|nr:VOC family protein [Streptosporangiales bacterium]MBO0890288.1 VOC family protein [Acidothermales bacterium]
MRFNRTTGRANVVPELVYPDVGQAVDWLCDVFGFAEVWRAGCHRARLSYGNGVVIVADADPALGRELPDRDGPRCHSVMVQVEDVDSHHEHARQYGARILSPPNDYAYGERQYSVRDLAGHGWTFTQSIADVAPEDRGGTSTGQPTA